MSDDWSSDPSGYLIYPCKLRARSRFTEPMLLLRIEKLPEGPEWLVELKLDG
jgi:hypothetical protein